MREKLRGAEQADQTRNGDGKKAQRRDSIIIGGDNGEGTTGNNRADDETKHKLRIGPWNVCGPQKSVHFVHDTARLHCLLCIVVLSYELCC